MSEQIWAQRSLKKVHVGEHIDFGLVHQSGQFGQVGPHFVGNVAPLLAGGDGIVLDTGGGDEGGDDAAAIPVGKGGGKGIAHEVDAAALSAGAEYLGGGLQPLVRVKDDQFNAAQAAPGQLVQKPGSEPLGLRAANIQAQNLAQDLAPACAKILTPMAIMTATKMMRPPSLTFT